MARSAPWPTTSENTWRSVAPSASRTAISPERCAVTNAITPKTPVAASTNAAAPNVAISNNPSLGQTREVEIACASGSNSTGTFASRLLRADPNLRRETFGVSVSCSDHEGSAQRHRLEFAHIDGRLGSFRQIRIRHVFDHADDLGVVRNPLAVDARRESAGIDALAQGIEPRQELPRPCPVHDDDRRSVTSIVTRKRSSGDDPHVERLEETGAYGARPSVRPAGRLRRTVGDVDKRRRIPLVTERQRRRRHD